MNLPRLMMLSIISTSLHAKSPRPELEQIKTDFAETVHEISGMTMHKGITLIVSDNRDDHFIYKIKPTDKVRFAIKPYIDLSKLKGYESYYEEVVNFKKLEEKRRRFDLEGLANCGESFYLANEGLRHILKVENGTISKLPIDFSWYKDLFEGGGNAGFEGLAVDCAGRRLFIAKEREPRMIFIVDMKTWKVVAQKDIDYSERQFQKVINPWSGEGHFTVKPDIAGLFYERGFLYVLERNTFEITKIDPKSFKVISRVSYFKAEKDLYTSGEPFGLAESLYLTADKIIVSFDNNGTPLTARAAKEFGVSGSFGSIVYLKRPKGF